MKEIDTWWDRAACRDVDPRIFDSPVRYRYVHGQRRKTLDPWYQARPICAECPVRLQCLKWVLEEKPLIAEHSSGAFTAGLTPEEIDDLRARRRRAS